ncbi:hypothetical protein [Neobacillus mesonae]|uniref:hypothetical protein n=1 Tax=Neobacillus mesonae TaxID=1193713 RepID=UPI002573350F|nr:hypothetical protein [Neobacillus mesonae]
MSSFKTSINIKFDFGEEELVKRYLPTPSHAESLKGLLKGLNSKSNSRSHIVVGPYGTGKSLLGTIFGSLVSKAIDKKTISVLIEKFNNVDEEIYKEFKNLQQEEKKYIPIILNGYEGNLRFAILSSIVKELKRQNRNIVVPGIVSSITSTVELWERNYPDTFNSFQDLLKAERRDFREWLDGVENYNKESIDWFKGVFPKLTSGVELPIDYNKDFRDQVKFVIDELSKENLGIFLIYDEFGRFLQNLDTAEIHETMQDLQDIAELANNHSNSFHILLITHRNMRQYGLKFSEELDKEFERIEQRYKVYNIESDKATFIRLSHEFLKKMRAEMLINVTDENIEGVKSGLRKFPLFADLNQFELENFIIDGSFPLHPVSLYLLPYLSNVLAQNERTLFTFLESDEKGGLIRHWKKSKDWYKPSILFDYFSPSLANYKDSEVMYLYNKVISRNKLNRDEKSVIKFISLWSIAEQESEFNLSSELISFANNWSNEKTDEILGLLKEKKIIRFNSNRDGWEIFQGSAVDVKEDIDKRHETNSLTLDKKLSFYNLNLKKRFYLPLGYNDNKSITRFASVTFVYAKDIINGDLDVVKLRKEKDADALIVNILGESEVNTDTLVDVLKNSYLDKLTYFCVPSFNNVDSLVYKLSIVEDLLNDKAYLQKDKPHLQKELEFIKEDISSDIGKFTQKYSTFSNGTVWIHKGKEILLRNPTQLEKHLSSLMSDTFNLTPEVRNDSFNRRKINSVQKNAAIKVIDCLLKNQDEENIGIEGYGPDYLIYASIIKNNNINLRNLDDINNVDMSGLRNRLVTELRENETGNLHDLVTLLYNEPFGIRKPLIPILLVSLLRDMWDKLIFYSNGMYVDTSSGLNIYDMVVNHSERYSYDFFELDKKYDGLVSGLEKLFNDFYSKEKISKHRPILLCDAMLSWLRSLPRISQITNEISTELIEFRKVIRRSEVAPIEAIHDLYEILNAKNNMNYFSKLKEELEQYFNKHQFVLKNKILNVFKVEDYIEVQSWGKQQDPKVQRNNPVVNVIINSNEDNWIERLCLSLVGVERKNWSDTTDAMFETQLINEIEKIKNENEYKDAISINVEGNTKVINRVELSPKSNDIYNNAKRLIKTAGRNVPKAEIEFLLYKLFTEAID